MKRPAMLTFAILINGTVSGYVKAVSHRQAVSRARKIHRGPIDVIGMIANAERKIPLSA